MVLVTAKQHPRQAAGRVVQRRPQRRPPERVAEVVLGDSWLASECVVESALPRDLRVAVDAEALQGDEVRPYVALLEGTHMNAPLVRDLARGPVERTAVAEQQHNVDLQSVERLCEVLRPVLHRPAPAERPPRIEQAVTAVEVDLVNFRSRGPQPGCQEPEERAYRSLQQQHPLAVQRLVARLSHVRPTVRRSAARRRYRQARFAGALELRHASNSSSASSAVM
jgi:hypothetical protein